MNPTSWTWGSTPAPRMNTHRVRIGQMDENNVSAGGIINDSHHCTVERLYAWEKKLFLEVKVENSICLRIIYLISRVLFCVSFKHKWK